MTNNMSSPASICLIWKGYIFDISVILDICTDPHFADEGTSVLKRGRVYGYQSRVTSALKRGDSRRLNGKPRPELDIDLYHGHPSLETRIWDRRSGLVVDGSGPMQDLPLGA